MPTITDCPCCGGTAFFQADILWPDLVQEWNLSPEEEKYINRQQGYSCAQCRCSLRSMALAAAIMHCQGYRGTFVEFVDRYSELKLLEMNEAGHLNPYLRKMKGHIFGSYPAVDFMNMPYKDSSFDMVVHSDTLEHVPDPVLALRETLRVLRPGGYTCYTVPLVVDRLSAGRAGKRPSYHGTPGNDEYLVHTEYGSDMWTQLMEAGFSECRLVSLDYPASIAVIGVKWPERAEELLHLA